MEEQLFGGSSEMTVTAIRYTDDLPDAHFSPDGLPGVIDHPSWQSELLSGRTR